MSGRRYLTPVEAVAALRRGSQIEQLLDRRVLAEGGAAIRWLTAFQSGGRFELVVHDVEDIGTDDFLDLSSFPPIDNEEDAGEGRSLATADEAEGVIDAAASHGACSERWVNFGVMQDEDLERRANS